MMASGGGCPAYNSDFRNNMQYIIAITAKFSITFLAGERRCRAARYSAFVLFGLRRIFYRSLHAAVLGDVFEGHG